MTRHVPVLASLAAALLAAALPAQQAPRARDLGIALPGTPGPLNAITDVAGVEVGHVTLIAGEGRLERGRGPVRTGVTAVLPTGRDFLRGVAAGWFTLNGNGEMTGTTWIEESGFHAGPILLTNTYSVGVVRDAVAGYVARRHPEQLFGLPVVAETFDGLMNDIDGMHVTAAHAVAAIDSARGGAVREGAVGGGTGMTCHQFKGGIGTASRRLAARAGGWTVGVLVQCNYGSRRGFRVDGVPVGQEIPDLMPCVALRETPAHPWLARAPKCPTATGMAEWGYPEGAGSIIVLVATDAPLAPHQLKRIAKRVALAIGRNGGLGEDSSGDIFLAFSTAEVRSDSTGIATLRMLDNERINPLFEATVQATEEAVLNAMVAARTMTGADGFRVHALPHDRLVAALRKYGRLP